MGSTGHATPSTISVSPSDDVSRRFDDLEHRRALGGGGFAGPNPSTTSATSPVAAGSTTGSGSADGGIDRLLGRVPERTPWSQRGHHARRAP